MHKLYSVLKGDKCYGKRKEREAEKGALRKWRGYGLELETFALSSKTK